MSQVQAQVDLQDQAQAQVRTVGLVQHHRKGHHKRKPPPASLMSQTQALVDLQAQAQMGTVGTVQHQRRGYHKRKPPPASQYRRSWPRPLYFLALSASLLKRLQLTQVFLVSRHK